MDYARFSNPSPCQDRGYYKARYVHKISPKPTDVRGPFTIQGSAGSAFSDRKNLAQALRKAGVLFSGERVRHFRVEGDKVIVFPGSTSVWHSIVIEPSDPGEKLPGVDYPGYR